MVKQNYIWTWLLVILGPFALLSVGLFSTSEPFGLHKICPSGSFFLQNRQIASQAEIEYVQEIASQPFEYLSENKEFYFFESKDHKYVIKFFKMRRMTPKYWLNHIPLPWLDAKRLRKVEGREKIRDLVFKSLQLSFENFRDQSGLIFLHLFRTNYIHKKIWIRGKNKSNNYYVSLDRVPFVLQKKTVPLFEHVTELLSQHKEEESIHILLQVLDLVKKGCLRGFIDKGERIGSHYGCLEGRVMHVDGNFIEEEKLKNPIEMARELFRVSRQIEAWLSKNAPHLMDRFELETQEMLSFIEEE